MDREEIKKLIIETIKEYNKSGVFTDRKTVDTPTDAYSIVNKKFVDDLILDDLLDVVITSVAQGQILYRGTTNWVNLVVGSSGKALTSGGVAANPSWEGMTTNGDVEYFSSGRARLPIGSAGEVLKVVSGLPDWTDAITFKNGTATRNGDTASGDQTIAHGLGITPKYVRITTWKTVDSNTEVSHSTGVYNGTTVSMIRSFHGPSLQQSGLSSTLMIMILDDTTSNCQEATISIDATNITLTWTKVGVPNANEIVMLWEAWG